MDELRVLHAADLHIDSPMRGLVAYDGAPVDEIRAATRTALRDLVAEAIDRQVHLLLLAGDLYEGSWRDYNTGLFVVSQLAELHDAHIPVVIVYGNHDAESQLTKRLRLPPNTTVLSSAEPETHVLSEHSSVRNPQLTAGLHTPHGHHESHVWGVLCLVSYAVVSDKARMLIPGSRIAGTSPTCARVQRPTETWEAKAGTGFE